jgi:hypothetical protein
MNGKNAFVALALTGIALSILGAAPAAAGTDRDRGQDSQQSYTNATGPNPFMPEFSTAASSGRSAIARYPAQHHVVHQR